MKFEQPIWLICGVLACAALIWRYRRFDSRQRAELKSFASAKLLASLTASVSPSRRRAKRVLTVIGVAFISIALARPMWGFRWEESHRKGLDLMFAVDVSRSMLAQDVKPDRLTRARMSVEDLLAKLDGDRVGLIAFAGNSFLQCPLTLDYDAFRQSLDVLDTKLIPRGGTDIASAIHEAETAFADKGQNERILILVTDGEDLEGSALAAAQSAAKSGVKIFTVGVGSASGELIPVSAENGGAEFVKDSSGQFVKSRLDEAMLKQIAEATGGIYQPLGQGQGLENIYSQGLAHFARHDVASRMHRVYLQRFQWPLALGILCLTLEPMIGIRRRVRRVTPAAIPASRVPMVHSWNRMARPARVAAAAAAVVILTTPGSLFASPQSAEKAYQQGKFDEAKKEYRQAADRKPGKPELEYNHGTAAYKTGDFDVAAKSFSQAMKTDDLKLQQDDFYNLGNTQYRQGQKTEAGNPQDTMKTWERAVQSYESALQLRPDDADAKYNRDFVKRKLEQLKKQQEQKQQQQQNQQDQQKQDQQQQNQDTNQQQRDQEQQSQQNNKQQDTNKDQANSKDQKSSGKDEQKEQNQQDKQAGNKDDQQKNQQTSNKPDQKQDDKQSQGSPKDSDKGDQKPKDQAGNAGDQKEQKPQDDSSKGQQASQKPDPAKQNAQPQARNSQPKDNTPEMADVRPEEGKMSREEAKELLDSLKSDDRKMPLQPYARGQESARNDEPIKDW